MKDKRKVKYEETELEHGINQQNRYSEANTNTNKIN